MAVIDNQLPMEATVVRIRNDDNKTFSQKYGGRRYVIEPGREAIVPFMAMCLWLGHPNAADLDKKRRFRTQEFQRLCVKWGVYEHHEKVDELFPKVSAWDMDGTEYITVVKDPDGKHLTPDVTTRMEREVIAEQMAAMQQQIAQLQARLNQNDKEVAAEIAAGDTRTDNPTHRPELQVPTGPNPGSAPPAGPSENGNVNDAMVDRPTPKPVTPTR